MLENHNCGQAFFQIDLLMNRVEINEGFNSIAEEKLPGLSIGHQKKLISIGKAGILKDMIKVKHIMIGTIV